MKKQISFSEFLNMGSLNIEEYLNKYDEIIIERLFCDLRIAYHPVKEKEIKIQVEYKKFNINDINNSTDLVDIDLIKAGLFIINNPDEYFIEGNTSLEFLLLWIDSKEIACLIGLYFLHGNQLEPFLKEILEKDFIDQITHDFIINISSNLLATWHMLNKYSNIIEKLQPNFFSKLGYPSYSPLEIFKDIVRYKFEDPLYLCLQNYYVSNIEDFKKISMLHNKSLKTPLSDEGKEMYKELIVKHIPHGHLEGIIDLTFYRIACSNNIEEIKLLYEFKQQINKNICRLQIEVICNPQHRPLKLLSNKWSKGKLL